VESDNTPVVPAKQLLEVAGVLSDGAARLHEQLSSLPPAERRALLDVVVGQVGDIVQAWSQLVRAVVEGEAPESTESPQAPQVHQVPHASQRAEASPGAGGPRLRRRSDRPGRDRLASVPDLEDEPVSTPISSTSRAGVVDEGPVITGPRGGAQPAMAGAVASPGEPLGLSRDELTGVLNRQAGFAGLAEEMVRCQQAGERFVVGYLNVDGLRHVNDTEGPRAGDELLRKVAAALQATLRAHDLILRLAGDEFLFSLPGADTTTANKRLDDFAVLLNQEAPGASVSVGFAELRAGDSLDDLVVRADDDLVEARRRRGRPRLR
jgi:diguanylate cyclase (GGDEF)-like protein